MIARLPIFICLLMIVSALGAIGFFYLAAHRSKVFLGILCLWIIAQSLVTLTGFYIVTAGFPPRFILLVFPALLFIIILFATKRGRSWMDGLKLEYLQLLHVVRIPVEIMLFYLFVYGLVPGLMTFEGRNFDILSGISALPVWYFAFRKKKLGRKFLLAWNIICILLLLNIVVNAVLSVPFKFQQFAFDQPNIAVLYFPFMLLPCCVVPLVLLSHLVSLRRLSRTQIEE
jgi:hypothetical protein